MGGARWCIWVVVVAACGGEPELTPVEHAAPAAPSDAAVTPAAATASAATSAPSAVASSKPPEELDLPKARDPRGISKRADGACFEFASKPCPPAESCKPSQPRRVRCPD